MIPIRLLYFRWDPHSTTPQIFKSRTYIFLLFFNHFFAEMSNLMESYLGGNKTVVTLEEQKTRCTLIATQILLSSWRNWQLIGGVCLVDLSTSVIFFNRDVEKFDEALSDRIHRPLCKFLLTWSRALVGGQPLAMGNPNDRTSSNLGKLVFW